MGNVKSSDSFAFSAFTRGGLWAELGWGRGAAQIALMGLMLMDLFMHYLARLTCSQIENYRT